METRRGRAMAQGAREMNTASLSTLPTSRKAALAGGLTKYTRGKPCKAGHRGVWHVVKGCLECRKVRTGKAHATRKLVDNWHDVLTDAIKTAREQPNFAKLTRVDYLTPGQQAELIGHVVTRARRDDKAPSVLTVGQDIGRLLEIPDETEAQAVGAALVGVAEASGFVAPLGTLGRVAGRMPASLVTLSEEAEEQRQDIEARLAAAAIPEASPSFTEPARGPVDISPNGDDIEAPPRPENEALITAAVAPIQGTAWRINQFMLKTLSALAASQSLDIDADAHAASIGALEQARALSSAPRFWYPCRLDWRGRIYQTGGRLQYTSGCDAARSLLEFADGEPVAIDGPGWGWLGIYVATCYGVRGAFADRMRWTLAHTSDIQRAVADPLDSGMLWRQAKEPYRFLAACDAWVRAQIPGALIHLPVAADATASMLQHYSLMTNDAELGAQVNMIAGALGDEPRDFYTDAGAPSGLTREDMKAGAWMLYGQTFDTLAVQLGSAEATRLMRASNEWRSLAARTGKRRATAILTATGRYARHAREAGRDKAKTIRDAWAHAAPSVAAEYGRLRAFAEAEAKAGRPLAWRLPDGFQVSQANRRSESGKVTLWLWDTVAPWKLEHRKTKRTAALDTRAQKDGYPANFVHSHDAALLREIIRQGSKVCGVPGWAVAHDSIAVHPNYGAALRAAAGVAVRWLYPTADYRARWYMLS
jgi:hypothetical protein